MSDQQSTYAKKVLFYWNAKDGSERIVIFEDGSLELSAHGKGMGTTISALIEKAWGKDPRQLERAENGYKTSYQRIKNIVWDLLRISRRHGVPDNLEAYISSIINWKNDCVAEALESAGGGAA